MRAVSTHRVVRAYSAIAETYDAAVGIADFIRIRRAFETLVTRYGIQFGSAVDVGCGTGLFACYLSQCWSVPVFAVDRSPEMIRVASRNCRNSNIRFLQQDFRRLCLPCPVDLATANTYTINHLMNEAEMDLAFQQICANLKPGGHLIFDLLTHCQPFRSSHTYVRRVRVFNRELMHRIRWDPSRRLLSIVILHRTQKPAPAAIEKYVGRGYSPLEVGKRLRNAGFRIRGIHDATTLRVAGACPARVIMVARKS